MIESLLLTTAHVRTFERQRPLTTASGFFFQREERLFLVTSWHIMIDEPGRHFPDRIEIELHVDPDNLGESTGFLIPLYRGGKSACHQGLDTTGEIDEALGLNCAWYADILLTLTKCCRWVSRRSIK